MEISDPVMQESADYADIPGFWESLDCSLLRDPLNAAAKAFFGLSYLFPYQRLVVANILDAAEALGIPIHWPGDPARTNMKCPMKNSMEPPDNDRASPGRQIVILPTGAGKSLCFQLPALLLTGPTLVIYPILSLMADQERRLQERGFASAVLRGGQSREERNALWERLYSRKISFIIANPEALLIPHVMEKLETLGIAHVVIDEAHCAGEWGESFRPGYLEIPKIINAAKAPLVTAFTATASAQVLEKIETLIFGGRGAHRIIGNPDRRNINYRAVGCILRDLAVRDLIVKNSRPAIVFCSSRLGTEKLACYLRNELQDRDIRFYHAGLNREEKTALEQWFFKHPRGILTATCAYGMGVDKADIRTVIHRDCPPSAEAYLQESGRAGRDGLPSKAILLWGPEDREALKRTQSQAERVRLLKLLAYTRNTTECRRSGLLALLDYEGIRDHLESDCCDVCEGTAAHTLREEPGLIRFFKRNRRRYTLTEAAYRLSQTERFKWSREDAQNAIQYLMKNNTLRKSSNFLWKGTLTINS